ncbi:hypothetical protein A2334_00615 [Candidatus Roizmanbacteria bacterium RIFOXYB2_FULL_38_10]|uniref:Uncharacterized protein n=1 Tax=Candidatus Roizmanbacteria bacterium RIFOXYD1_FULL_38_12 TaxID=1802093 RepID=A0A1F7L1B3_9BACT|nr:MAG: hypothetical protein A3K47_03885 [Candidatus Roizmanbacteria bacterium RIFOXYA2_FULL_38_14]OGK63898.1 MAG: hypothetical protein A3K27_03885 [Candidatus Roizmanbacteria bacterium RIFOXYA1_FULL_37_12]OGK65744.1 MAG: hypothetical protein A3K38_03885 [Candidatus Roizmanbacteria bacterium RIFOXYB1_FULL_40_23]OGK68189.1 MAG: hypothetical protein A2334_00615 [Candidatus Roizmanbacteria bacterium RIFOXYB2_FULL_38_10]OGK70149.1 MAG: hypothetical protein A3K21_03890 [Candidatus Roizmanbacteria ba
MLRTFIIAFLLLFCIAVGAYLIFPKQKPKPFIKTPKKITYAKKMAFHVFRRGLPDFNEDVEKWNKEQKQTSKVVTVDFDGKISQLGAGETYQKYYEQEATYTQYKSYREVIRDEFKRLTRLSPSNININALDYEALKALVTVYQKETDEVKEVWTVDPVAKSARKVMSIKNGYDVCNHFIGWAHKQSEIYAYALSTTPANEYIREFCIYSADTGKKLKTIPLSEENLERNTALYYDPKSRIALTDENAVDFSSFKSYKAPIHKLPDQSIHWYSARNGRVVISYGKPTTFAIYDIGTGATSSPIILEPLFYEEKGSVTAEVSIDNRYILLKKSLPDFRQCYRVFDIKTSKKDGSFCNNIFGDPEAKAEDFLGWIISS